MVAQEKPKPLKELEREALKFFEDGDYESARKIWMYIRNDYPRKEFQSLPKGDIRLVRWQFSQLNAIIRDAFTQKLLQGADPKQKAAAEAAYLDVLATCRIDMGRMGIPRESQESNIRFAEQPLRDALKKK
jgi:hypothetical protein